MNKSLYIEPILEHEGLEYYYNGLTDDEEHIMLVSRHDTEMLIPFQALRNEAEDICSYSERDEDGDYSRYFCEGDVKDYIRERIEWYILDEYAAKNFTILRYDENNNLIQTT